MKNNATHSGHSKQVHGQAVRPNIVRLVFLWGLLMALLTACSDSVPPASVVPTAAPTQTASPPTETIPPPPTDVASDTPVPADTPEPTVQEAEATSTPPPVAVVPTATGAAPVTPITPATIPDGPLTVVALGDSLTEGDGDDWQRGGYPSRLGEMINNLRPGSRIVNLGKSGWDSNQMVAEQLPAALEAKPQIALVWIGSNDLWKYNAPEQQESDLANYTANIDTTLRSLSGVGAVIFIALLDDQSLRPFAQPANGYYDLEGLALMSRRITAYNKMLAAKAAEYGAVTVDFFNTTIFTDPATLAEDGLHPNPKGYDIVAGIWFDAIRPKLQR